MRIDIEIPHPLAAVLTIAATIGAIAFVDHATGLRIGAALPIGGQSPQESVYAAEEDGMRLRQQQAVLQKREEILRYQLELLRQEKALRGDNLSPAMQAELERSEQMLLDLLRDQQEAEGKILQTLKQIWEAEGRAIVFSRKSPSGHIALTWPLEPVEGISALFNDAHYEEIFGMPHKAIDIPAEQGTTVHAAADGVVENVTDNGYGFNSVTIRHDGYVTLYGHVETFLVEEGQTVRRGDPIALSGGMPGTKGAGHISTGPHLHFELIVNGERTDPLVHLPMR
jgi:murein DD-endopeptidase MepM/ murein hydrolase activator NlpD